MQRSCRVGSQSYYQQEGTFFSVVSGIGSGEVLLGGDGGLDGGLDGVVKDVDGWAARLHVVEFIRDSHLPLIPLPEVEGGVQCVGSLPDSDLLVPFWAVAPGFNSLPSFPARAYRCS